MKTAIGEDCRALIRDMLAVLPDASVSDQLRWMGVGQIRLEDMPCNLHGRITLCSIPSKWDGVIYLRRTAPFRQWLHTVGHEISHIFELMPDLHIFQRRRLIFCELGFPDERSPGWWWTFGGFEEKLCDGFSRAWLNSCSNRHELVELLTAGFSNGRDLIAL